MMERPVKEAQRFGAAVREWRVSEGMSLGDLADLLVLSPVQVAGLERGLDETYVTQRWPRIVADLRRLGFPS